MQIKEKYPDLSDQFRKIAPCVTTEDVMRTALEMGCHYETVNRYLAGKVLQKGYGKIMLQIIQGHIDNRLKKQL